MKSLSFALVADLLFYSACAFLAAVGVLRFYGAPLWLALVCAAAIALAVGGIAFLLMYRSRHKKYLTKKEREAREALILHLTLEKPERVRAALLSAYLADGKNAHCEGDTLAVDGVPVVPLFTMEPVSADEIARLLREYGKEPFCVACNSLSADAEKLLSAFGIAATGGDEIYSLFSRTETVPDPLICGEIPRKTAKQKFRRSYSKSNARPFFVSGALLLLMSLFTFFPLYYVIAGSVLLFCAVAVRLFGYA